ncbi:C4-dicarboxylate ABC transporter permease [Sorangium cellulosum]|uniref:C4-dicarboxylate ABC transporter permease n=1 Tax=Sorangium cellulosum TaxID=56 RepID=A0A2L0ETQ3_SORCE|nr:TRAP transporter large permease [Sorangium cellulosum]AUX42665.1 C4-dicarboxylate ABC transporter permease [Sorangium cellulosum]
MEIQVLILVFSFFALLLLNVPVAVCIGLSTVLTIASLGDVPTAYIVAQRMSTGIASFPLLAIPFFVLAGVLMGEGGMARRLMDFASAVVGRFHGGLAYVNTLTCMLFGAVSGSAAAAVSSVGGFMIPEMERKNYGRDFSVALTTTSATTGLLIPPSNIMIVYAVVAGNVSVAALFLAGVIPGVLVGLCIMAVAFMANRKQAVGLSEKVPLGAVVRSFAQAIPSLFMILIVMGGILTGVFSATEASAVSVAYAFLLGALLYREIKLKDMPRILLKSSKTTAVVMILVGASQAMSWVLAYEQVPQGVSQLMLGISESPIATLLIINVLLLVVGTFMDMTPAVLIFTPIFLPVVTKMGMNPVHFGILMITNLCIGLCTPPVGTCLFVGCGVGKTTIARVVRPMIPMFAAMIVALMLISYVPGLSLWLPSQLGL